MVDLPKRRTLTQMDFVAEQTVYLTADGRIVGDKDPAKLTKLVHTGGRLRYEEALRYGLIEAVSAEPAAIVETETEQVGQPTLLEVAEPPKQRRGRR